MIDELIELKINIFLFIYYCKSRKIKFIKLIQIKKI